MKLPKTAPIISANDVVKGIMRDRDSIELKCCLLGHIRYNLLDNSKVYTKNHCLTASSKRLIKQVESAIYNVITDELKLDLTIVRFNDHYANKTLIAKVWNRAMYNLGYTEGNLQNKPLGRR